MYTLVVIAMTFLWTITGYDLWLKCLTTEPGLQGYVGLGLYLFTLAATWAMGRYVRFIEYRY